MRKLNYKHQRQLVCGLNFVASSCVLIFAVIGWNTINIPLADLSSVDGFVSLRVSSQ